ncbi:hypothetical protein B0H13DRAFT_1663246 [Mycena leptocephala]|nr:hypothetical protein B0H13DRAFT_1663246 [Mycena leptocephala]
MSTFNVFGFFALAAGKRVATHPPGATYPIHHNHYVTSVKSTSDDPDTYPSATLRVYSAAGDAPLPDNTIAFIVAKAFAPTGKPIELDVLYMSAIPGDPNNDDYEVRFRSQTVFLICLNFSALTDGSKTLVLSLTEYVNGAVKSSAVECMLPATRRWANTPFSRAQGCTQFLGKFNGFSDSALLQIVVDHVTLSLRPHSIAQATSNPSTATPGTTTTPNKRKKYVAISSVSTPTTGASTTAASTQDRPSTTMQ